MRRTFNDVARAAKAESLVTKRISGHLTDRTTRRSSPASSERASVASFGWSDPTLP
jgi:hypothetical protein